MGRYRLPEGPKPCWRGRITETACGASREGPGDEGRGRPFAERRAAGGAAGRSGRPSAAGSSGLAIVLVLVLVLVFVARPRPRRPSVRSPSLPMEIASGRARSVQDHEVRAPGS